MLKKGFFAILLLLICSLSFAQELPKKILAAADIDTFLGNYAGIQTDLGGLGNKYDSFFDPEGNSANQANADPAAAFNRLRNATAPDEVQSIFRNHGLGDNGFAKYLVISYGVSVLYMEKLLTAPDPAYTASPEAKAYFEHVTALVKNMRSTVNADDLSLLATRQDELIGLYSAGNQSGE